MPVWSLVDRAGAVHGVLRVVALQHVTRNTQHVTRSKSCAGATAVIAALAHDLHTCELRWF